jgi:hypothetical protein
MFIIFLASIVGGDPAVISGNGSKYDLSFADAAPRDVQQIAIEAITGRSLTTSPSDVTPSEGRKPTGPQAEIVSRITGRNVDYPRVLRDAGGHIDLQSALMGSISGRH